jgi:hypothetical protein
LPSDKRYRNLSEEQIDILFLYHVMRSTDEQLRETYRSETEALEAQNTLPAGLLLAQGYKPEEIEAMKKAIPSAMQLASMRKRR